MSVKEIIAQVRAKLTDEESSKINSLLSSIEREMDALQSDLSSANSESKKRKESIRTLKAEMEDLQDGSDDGKGKIDKLENEIKELKKVQKEFNVYKEKESKVYSDKWDGRKTVFDIEDTDPEFEKVNKIKHKFHFAKEDKQLTAKQVIANNTLYDTYDEIGYFKKDESDLEDGKSPKGKPNDEDSPFGAFPSN